jgi:1-pyrroline-5-carboxylate dehydrogenase
VQAEELSPFIKSLAACPKSGVHNPFRNVDRYLMLGSVSDKISRALRTPEIADFFTRLVMRTSPKSYKQAAAEVSIWCVGLLAAGAMQRPAGQARRCLRRT